MVQIIGANLELAIQELNIDAEKKFQAEPDFLDVALQVWELSDEQFAYICNIEPENWEEEYGWWVNGGCNHSLNETKPFIINNESILAFTRDSFTADEYPNLSDYLESHIGISKYNNIAYYIHSLAELNNMSKAELMKKYW